MNKELFKAIEIEPDHEVLGELFLSLGKVKDLKFQLIHLFVFLVY